MIKASYGLGFFALRLSSTACLSDANRQKVSKATVGVNVMPQTTMGSPVLQTAELRPSDFFTRSSRGTSSYGLLRDDDLEELPEIVEGERESDISPPESVSSDVASLVLRTGI